MPVKPMDLADQEGVMVEVGEDGENPFSDKAVRRAFIRKVCDRPPSLEDHPYSTILNCLNSVESALYKCFD